jgi:hypothetical protein
VGCRSDILVLALILVGCQLLYVINDGNFDGDDRDIYGNSNWSINVGLGFMFLLWRDAQNERTTLLKIALLASSKAGWNGFISIQIVYHNPWRDEILIEARASIEFGRQING